MLETVQVKQIICEALISFREKDMEKYSYKWIGNRVGMSHSFVERAAKNTLGEELDSKKILAISGLVCSEENKLKLSEYFADKILGESSDILKDALYAKFVAENERAIEKDLEQLLTEEGSYVSYILSANDNGTTEAAVQKIGGDTAVHALKKLNSRGFIKLENGIYHALRKNISYSFGSLKKVINSLTRYYKPENVGKQRNYAHVVTNALSREGIVALQDEHRRHHEEIRNIVKTYEGDIDVFSAGFMDTFTSDELPAPKSKDAKMKTLNKTLSSFVLIALAFTLSPKLIAGTKFVKVTADLGMKVSKVTAVKLMDGRVITRDEISVIDTHGENTVSDISVIETKSGELLDSSDIARVVGGGDDSGGG